MGFDTATIRTRFPSLTNDTVFLDNPGGTQISQNALDQINRYLLEMNANHGGAFPTSIASDALLDNARSAMADFLKAARPEEIVFGPNMTSLTFNISLSLIRELSPGDHILVTRLDHDANITPWKLAAEEHDCEIRFVSFDKVNGTLDLDDFRSAMSHSPRIVAFGYASNSLGTINPVKEMTQLAHDAGALVYIDAVQFAPHGKIDVQEIGCDFLVCSAYKFFGPHIGALYGRYDLLERLKAYKVVPAEDNPPYKFETGTQNHEGIAGILGAIEYFEWVGEQYGQENKAELSGQSSWRRHRIRKAMSAIQNYEAGLSRRLLEILGEIPGVKVYGQQDPKDVTCRVPTISFTVEGIHPRTIAEQLGESGVNVWDGHYYAVEVVKHLGLDASGGMVRVGAVHYNTMDEIEQFGELLSRICL